MRKQRDVAGELAQRRGEHAEHRGHLAEPVALEAAVRVPGLVATMLTAAVQEHERGLGNWPAEWTTLPDIALCASGALAAMVEVVEGLDVDADRMRTNLDITQGLIFAEAVQMALAPEMGRGTAHSLVAGACRRAIAEHAHLREILAQEPKVTQILDAQALVQLFDSQHYLGATHAFIERVLAGHAASAT